MLLNEVLCFNYYITCYYYYTLMEICCPIIVSMNVSKQISDFIKIFLYNDFFNGTEKLELIFKEEIIHMRTIYKFCASEIYCLHYSPPYLKKCSLFNSYYAYINACRIIWYWCHRCLNNLRVFSNNVYVGIFSLKANITHHNSNPVEKKSNTIILKKNPF